jgi:hypothetical protein
VAHFSLDTGAGYGCGAVSALSCIACLSIWYAVHGRGPFTEQSPDENVLTLQLFLIGVAACLLALALLIEERQRAADALQESERRFRMMADTAPAAPNNTRSSLARLRAASKQHADQPP